MFLPAVNLLSSVITQVPLYRGDRAAVYFVPQNVCISGNASEEPRGIFWLTAQNRTFAQKKFLQIGAAPYAKQGALPLACLADPSVQSQVSSGFMTLGSRGYSWPIWTFCSFSFTVENPNFLLCGLLHAAPSSLQLRSTLGVF